jgi:two-component system, chemotaxis family, sensor kinase Cph1
MTNSREMISQIGEFFSDIFSTTYWPARWHCGKWTDFHGWLYIVSDLMIWSAYFAIPLLLFRIITKRVDIPFPKVFWLFIAFILLCGGTHLMDAVIFWWPAYRLSAVIRFVTGIVSLLAVFSLYKILPLVHSLRTASQLEHEIEQRKKAEEQTRLQLHENEQTLEMLKIKDEFITLASHELKTPLTSLKGYLQLLQLKSLDASPQHREFITKASNQAARLQHLIDNLFNVSKMQMGLDNLNRDKFRLNDIIQESKEQFSETGSVVIETELEADEFVEADQMRIKQVLDNLIDNAIKYSPSPKKIIINTQTSNNRVRVGVKDFGLGIPDDKVQYVFDRYFRVEHTSQNYPGMGLGLYICAQLITQHGGVIGVESKLGSGSTFWFELPIESQPEIKTSIKAEGISI